MNKGVGWELKKPYELYDHQVETYSEAMKYPRSADYSKAGTGKSLPAACALLSKISQGMATKLGENRYVRLKCRLNAVIFSPPTALIGWLETFAMFLNKSADVVRYHGTMEKRRLIRRQVSMSSRPTILLVSWGLLSHSVGAEEIAWLDAEFKPHYIIADEAQYVAGEASIRTKDFIGLFLYPARAKEYRQLQLLTATPITNGPQKAWTFFYLLHQDIMTGRNKAYPDGLGEFYDRHFTGYDDQRRGFVVTGFHQQEYFKKVFGYKSIMHEREDVFKDRKEPIFKNLYFELGEEQQLIYDTFIELLEYYCKEKDILLKGDDFLQRVCRERQLGSNPAICGLADCRDREDILLISLRDHGILPMNSRSQFAPNGDKVLILTEYRHTWTQLVNSLKEKGYGVVGINGSMRFDKRKAAIDLFNADERINVFVGMRPAMSEGTNLQRANVCVNYEINWMADKYIQGLGRVDRAGQLKQLYYINIIAQNTIDQVIFSRLLTKIGVEHEMGEVIRKRSDRKKSMKRLKKSKKEVFEKLTQLAIADAQKLKGDEDANN